MQTFRAVLQDKYLLKFLKKMRSVNEPFLKSFLPGGVPYWECNYTHAIYMFYWEFLKLAL